MTKASRRQAKTKGEKKNDVERKRDERSKRNALRKERKGKDFYSIQDDDDYLSFCNQLQVIGLKIKDTLGDGNCLFRALSDQLEGDQNTHGNYRQEAVEYMKLHSADFEPFHLEDKPFADYLEDLGKEGTYAGNDAIVAFARIKEVDVVIHQFNNPRFVISGHRNPDRKGLHIAYHNGEHYSSLRRLNDNTRDPAYLLHDKQQAGQQFATETKCNRKPTPNPNDCLAKNTTECPAEAVECSEVERSIMNITKCEDLISVRRALADNDFDVDNTMAYLLQLLCLAEAHDENEASDESCKENPPDNACSISDHKQTKSRSSIPKHLSNRQRKELAKQHKKKQREESQRQQSNNESKSPTSNEGFNDLGSVAI